MIAYIQGTIIRIDATAVVVETGGVGYLLHIPYKYLVKTQLGEVAVFHVYTHVREDEIKLFGFATVAEFRLFELLLSVSGIGPKTALAVINKGVETVEDALRTANVDFFMDVPRLGRKNAQKIIIELGSKMTSDNALQSNMNPNDEAIVIALTKMGFMKNEVLKAISHIPEDKKTVKDRITVALQILGTR